MQGSSVSTCPRQTGNEGQPPTGTASSPECAGENSHRSAEAIASLLKSRFGFTSIGVVRAQRVSAANRKRRTTTAGTVSSPECAGENSHRSAEATARSARSRFGLDAFETSSARVTLPSRSTVTFTSIAVSFVTCSRSDAGISGCGSRTADGGVNSASLCRFPISGIFARNPPVRCRTGDMDTETNGSAHCGVAGVRI
jgi:hypothetical protein